MRIIYFMQLPFWRFSEFLINEATRILQPTPSFSSEKVFVSQERVSGFPEKGADLRGSPGTSGEVWGTSGEVWETSGEPPDC